MLESKFCLIIDNQLENEDILLNNSIRIICFDHFNFTDIKARLENLVKVLDFDQNKKYFVLIPDVTNTRDICSSMFVNNLLRLEKLYLPYFQFLPYDSLEDVVTYAEILYKRFNTPQSLQRRRKSIGKNNALPETLESLTLKLLKLVPDLGEKKTTKLLIEFESLSGLATADPKVLTALIGTKSADSVEEFFN